MKKTLIQLGAFTLSLAFMLGMMVPGLAMGQDTITNKPAPAQDTITNKPPPAGNKTVTAVAPITGGIQNPLKGVTSIADLFYAVVNFIYSLSYAVIAIFLIISGFKFVAAQGNEDKLTDAKNTFKYTIIGAILLIGANVITEVVRNVINQFSTNKI